MGLINETGLAEFTTKIKNYLFRKLGIYAINLSVSGGTYSGDSTIKSGETATITITASSGFALPSTILVSGASYTWDSQTGVIVLSNATGDVAISVVCESQAEAFLTFSAADNFTLSVIDNAKYWDGTLEYSTDKTTWNTWGGTGGITSNLGKLYLRGTGNTILTGSHVANSKRWTFSGTSESPTIYISGNIETLLDYATVEGGNHPPMANRCFQDLFRGGENTIPTDSRYIDASNLVLGALTGTANCYQYMFAYSSITKAPKIMLTSLQNYSCYSMFYNCEKLSTIPKIYVKNFAYTQCCLQMFARCSLIKISQTQTGAYVNEYAIPITKDGTTTLSGWNSDMFYSTGGTFTGNPNLNITYYTSNEVV